MVVETLVFHPTVTHYLRFMQTTVGRDKIFRTLQYFARFFAWYRLRTNASPAEVQPWLAMRSQLTKSRRLLTATKNLEHIKQAVLAAIASTSNTSPQLSTSDSIIRYATVGRQLGYAGYLTLDLVLIPDMLGIFPWKDRAKAKQVRRQATRFWTLGILFSVVAQLYTLRRLREREAQVAARSKSEDGEAVVESKRIAKERKASRLQLLCDACDLTNTTSSLGWTSFDDGVVGLAGTCSSLVGLYNQWKKTA